MTGSNRRTIRFYIQSEILDRPEGTARGAYYTRRHLQRILDISAWQSEGLTIDGIRQRLASDSEQGRAKPRSPIEVWTRVNLTEGLELNVNAESAGLTSEDLRHLATAIRETLETIKLKRGQK